MKEFKFKENKAKMMNVKIDGKTYTFNPKSLIVKKAIEKFNICQKPLIKKLESKKLTSDELTEINVKACNSVREAINKMLGKNSYEKIFQNRTADFEEHMEVISYLFNEITEFINEHTDTKVS